MLTGSEPLTDREAVRTQTHTNTGITLQRYNWRTVLEEEESMGFKLPHSALPSMNVLISKKLHILRPAIEYVQQIGKSKKVRARSRCRVFGVI